MACVKFTTPIPPWVKFSGGEAGGEEESFFLQFCFVFFGGAKNTKIDINLHSIYFTIKSIFKLF